MLDSSFWSGKSVLITGHTGFKGSWLSLWLSALGARVHGYSQAPNTEPNLYDLAQIGTLSDSKIADINDATQLGDYIASAQPDIVFHLAAQALVRESFTDPVTTLQTNVMGTVNVLEAVRRCQSVKALVVVTSDKCYQNNEWHWGYRENEPLGGHDPYSASKACAELVVQAWRLSFMSTTSPQGHSCAVASARAGNVIGGGDWSKDRLIPDVLNSISQGQDIVLRNPNAIRPWQHVLEPLAGYLLLAQKLSEDGQSWAEAWNFGPHDSDARPVSSVVSSLLHRLNSKNQWTTPEAQQPHEAQHLKLDCSKAADRLGWTPVWGLDDTLADIAAWHHAFNQDEDMRSVSLKTIQRYMDDAARAT